MNRRWLLCLLPLLLAACSNISDTRPEVIRNTERMLEQGVRAHGNGDYTGAIDLFSRALTHYRSIDYRQGMLLSELNLAETTLASGRHEAAAGHIEQASLLAREQDDQEVIQRTRLLLARWYWQQQQTQESLALLSGLLPEFAGERPLTRPTSVQLAAISLRTDIALQSGEQTEPWLARLRQGITPGSPDEPWHRARLQRFEAQLAASRGDSSGALALLDEALQVYREAALRPAIAATLSEAAQIHLQQEQWEEAEPLLQRALFIRVWMMDRVHSQRLLVALGNLYQALGQEEQAAISYRLAATINSAAGNEEWQQLQRAVKPR